MATAIREPEAPEAQEAPAAAPVFRLSLRQWLVVAAIVLAFAAVAPRAWNLAERFDIGPDYRVPYALSSDYWLFQRRIDSLPAGVVPVLGDSVVWGEYVRPDGTLSHYLSALAPRASRLKSPARFANCGVNGVFPLAMEGLLRHYAAGLRNRRVILQCNVLWMSSPKVDLSSPEEQTFNHPGLVPQGLGRVPSYHADAATRLGYLATRNLGFFAWVNHVNDVYFDQMSLPKWTLDQDDRDPPGCPNAWKNPLGQIALRVPGEPAVDPQRGPTSPRHHPWDAHGAQPQRFEWVLPQQSLQWHAFQRTVRLLRGRGNDVLVILGPFNEHMVAAEQRPLYRRIRDEIASWLTRNSVPQVVPGTLPSALYADASHPLTEGYAELARRLWREPAFARWLAARP